jgi:hypothetical protein
MRLLIDDCLPRALKRLLHGHTCRTVQEMAWSGIKKGALLSLAEGEFDALITIDQGLEYQQNLKERRIAILLLVSRSNQIEDLAPIIPAALTALETILPGQVVRIGESWSGFPACLHRRLSYPGAPISPVAKADQNLRNLQVNIFKASKEKISARYTFVDRRISHRCAQCPCGRVRWRGTPRRQRLPVGPVFARWHEQAHRLLWRLV